MAHTLLNGVNDVLKRVRIIRSSSLLTSLTDSAKQSYIDIAVSIWNEAMLDVYSATDQPLPKESASNTIVLATGDRDYALQTDVVQLRFPIKDETNGHYIWDFPGGFEALRIEQNIPGNYTGQPSYAVIRPSDGELYLDRIPTAAENGDTYTYWYDKDILMSAFDDVFPFNDSVYTALMPAVAQLWSRDQKRDFDKGKYTKSIGVAARLLTNVQQRTSYLPLQKNVATTDPYE